MIAKIGRMPIWKSCFCSLGIILYIMLFDQVNWTSFSLKPNLDYIWTMSFFSQRDVHYLVDQFYYWLLIRYMKMLAMLQRQRFENNRSDETEPRVWKRQRLDERDNEEKNGLDEDEGEIEGAKYVSSPFIPLLLPQKMSNRPSNLGKGTKSLNHLIYVPKICYSRSANFALEFPGRGGSKAQKKIYISRVREGLESHLASTAFTASGTTNHCRLIRERLKSHLASNHCQDLEI